VDYNNLLQNILVYALPVLFAITVHEASHGYVARHFGDPTAYILGRVTLNPVKHIDPFGTVLMPLILLFSTAALPGGPFLLGYAKPVPVNFGQLRHPKRDMIWVAIAGPVSNFIQALLWGLLLVALVAFGIEERFFIAMARAGIQVNLVIAVFNLFPLPPLDGGRVLVGMLPARPAYQLARVEPFGFFIVLALLIPGILNTWWMAPLMGACYSLLNLVLTPLLNLVR
jgi:Zn-dependent protease